MADTLEIPDDPEALVLTTGDDVSPNRPFYTGDVFRDIPVDVLGEQSLPVVVVSHPCAMRSGGSELQSHIHVAPLVEHSESGPQMWRGNYRLMALDALAPVVRFRNPVVRLDRMTLIPSDVLIADKRIACLERYGVDVLRQRLVHHLTRLAINRSVLDREAAGTHEEVDLLEDWTDFATDRGSSVKSAVADFDNWLSADDRRAKLADPAKVPALRRAAQGEMRERYAT